MTTPFLSCLQDWIIGEFGRSGIRSKCCEKKAKIHLDNLPPKIILHGDNCSKKIHRDENKPKSCDCIVVAHELTHLHFLLIELKKNISSFDDTKEDFIEKMQNSWRDVECVIRYSGCPSYSLKCYCLFLVIASNWEPSFKKRIEGEQFYIDGIGPFRIIAGNNVCSLSKYIPEVFPVKMR